MTPERIKAWPWNGKSNSGQWHVAGIGETTEYVRADLFAAQADELKRLRAALTKLRDLMCEGFEDDDGNSGCGKCENDCTGCIADRALKGCDA